MPWDDLYTSHTQAEVGGVVKPPAKAMCAACGGRRDVAEMRDESNPQSGAFGFLVCAEPHEQGGCFEGVQPDRTKPAKSDDISPVGNIFY